MHFFSRLFEAPAYMHLPAFGLDISDNSLKYMKLARARGVLSIQDFGSTPIPSGIIESGVIRDEGKLTEILKHTFAPKPHLSYVSLSLPEEKGFVRFIRLPHMTEEEAAEAIPLQLEEHVPLAASETAFSYRILPGDGPGEHTDVLTVAFPRSLVESYTHIATEAGLTPIALELEAQATSRAVIPWEEHAKTILIADIGLTRTGFMIVENGLVEFTSTVPVGGREINKAIADAFKTTPDAAERFKVEHGMDGSHEGNMITQALAPIIKTIRDEALRRIDFWRAHAGDLGRKSTREVEAILLCGGDANLVGLPNYLSYELKIPVSLANVWSNVIQNDLYVPEIEFNASLGYATTIGLALGAAVGET